VESKPKIPIIFYSITWLCVIIGALRTQSVIRGLASIFGPGATNTDINIIYSIWALALSLSFLLAAIFCLKSYNLARKILVCLLAYDVVETVWGFAFSLNKIGALIEETYETTPLFRQVPFPILEVQAWLIFMFSILIPAFFLYYYTRESVVEKFSIKLN
jgi:hypothetical protein